MFRSPLVSDFGFDHERRAYGVIFEPLRRRFSSLDGVNLNLVVQPNILSSIPDSLIISNNLPINSISLTSLKTGLNRFFFSRV
ncbi:MAG: hypothetical protein PWQ16_1411 [bacterium]|nr:MAG: hypothetical protein XD52_0761 [bacterium 42_11]MDK2872059.1 hypothetical protein [bacterium]